VDRNMVESAGASSPWLVLGGGGLKGLAHVGAWQALREYGYRPAGIVGTSIGALVGTLIAAGTTSAEMRALAAALRKEDIIRVNRLAVWINGIRQESVFRGDTLREYLERILPSGGWDALEIPLQVNAVDLGTGDTVWFGHGARTDVSLVDAVHASAALPVFYPPVWIDGRAYVDGGTAYPLAIHRAAHLGADHVTAVDVGAGPESPAEQVVAKGMLAVHQRIFAIMTFRRRRDALATWNGPPLRAVRPKLDGYEAFDFEHVGYFVDEGYAAMRAALASS